MTPPLPRDSMCRARENPVGSGPAPVRVATYNLLDGGRDPDGSEHRWQVQAKVIGEVIRPDLLLVQEARQWEGNGFRLLFQAEREFGMRGLLAISPNTGHHTALFYGSRFTVHEFTTITGGLHHSAALASVGPAGFTRPITVISAHLSPWSGQTRLAEAALFTCYAQDGILTILGGDLGCPPPGTHVDLSTVPLHALSQHALPGSIPPVVDTRAVALLYQAGFVDPVDHLDTGGAHTAGHFSADGVLRRCDHLLLSPRLAPALNAYQVLDNTATCHSSDHLPAYIDLDLTLIPSVIGESR